MINEQPVDQDRPWAPSLPNGAGIGLRGQHIPEVIQHLPDIPWFEILADNHLAEGGLIPHQLTAVRSSYPVTFHCVGMSIAGVDPLDMKYLQRIRSLAERFEPAWISDHLCFTQFAKHQYHDLLPFPYSEESLNHVGERVMRIQDYLGRALVVENVSAYLQYRASIMTEGEFLKALCQQTGCEILLDVNNAYVNQVNHGIDTREFIRSLPAQHIREIHLAGFEDKGGYLIDAHNNRVADAVWELYEYLVHTHGETVTLIEWDNDIPSFEVLAGEARHAQQILDSSVKESDRKNCQRAGVC
ncbi:MAG: DUF692 domain-containing protein [Arenicellales bacterium]|jgi:hypothetical protein